MNYISQEKFPTLGLDDISVGNGSFIPTTNRDNTISSTKVEFNNSLIFVTVNNTRYIIGAGSYPSHSYLEEWKQDIIIGTKYKIVQQHQCEEMF